MSTLKMQTLGIITTILLGSAKANFFTRNLLAPKTKTCADGGECPSASECTASVDVSGSVYTFTLPSEGGACKPKDGDMGLYSNFVVGMIPSKQECISAEDLYCIPGKVEGEVLDPAEITFDLDEFLANGGLDTFPDDTCAIKFCFFVHDGQYKGKKVSGKTCSNQQCGVCTFTSDVYNIPYDEANPIECDDGDVCTSFSGMAVGPDYCKDGECLGNNITDELCTDSTADRSCNSFACKADGAGGAFCDV